MTAATTDFGTDVETLHNALLEPVGYRVTRADGTVRKVLHRLNPQDDGWAVFAARSTDTVRKPALGYPGSWTHDLSEALKFARTHEVGR